MIMNSMKILMRLKATALVINRLKFRMFDKLTYYSQVKTILSLYYIKLDNIKSSHSCLSKSIDSSRESSSLITNERLSTGVYLL